MICMDMEDSIEFVYDKPEEPKPESAMMTLLTLVLFLCAIALSVAGTIKLLLMMF